MVGRAVGVYVIVTDTLELQVCQCRQILGKFLYKCILVDSQRLWIQEGSHGIYASYAVLLLVLLDGITGILASPQTFIVPNFAGNAMFAAYPVKCLTLNLAIGTRHSAFAVGVVCGMYAYDVAVLVFLYALIVALLVLFVRTGNDVTVLQANLLAGA